MDMSSFWMGWIAGILTSVVVLVFLCWWLCRYESPIASKKPQGWKVPEEVKQEILEAIKHSEKKHRTMWGDS